ncbi:hypothetical protein PG996_006767 [Apiospora saccharicola]|uniref:Uncharacterized protein n=1 Tax=Apiospora saccharicola TaxID=335842 RepID=A0ABR1VBN1_9PEZI
MDPESIRGTNLEGLEGLLFVRGLKPKPKSLAKYFGWCKIAFRVLICVLFVYSIYPLVPAMGVSTVCRLPKVVRPSYVCRVGDAHSFQLQSLFDAVESQNKRASFWYEKICDDSGSKLVASIEALGQHDMWTLPDYDEDDNDFEFYYRRSKTDAVLLMEARRGVDYRRAASNLTALCHELREFRGDAARQTDRDLTLNVYQTTGQWAQLLNHLRIAPIDEERVDGLVAAFLASVNTTFERWASLQNRVEAAIVAQMALGYGNEEVLETVAAGHSTVLDDLSRMVDLNKTFIYSSEPRTSCNLWGLSGSPSVISRQDVAAFLGSLEAVKTTAIRSKHGLADIWDHLRSLDRSLNQWGNRFVVLKDISKAALLEDWEQHESEIVLKAAAWRQWLVGRYNAKQWFFIFQSAYLQGKAFRFWGYLEMITEPAVTSVLIEVINPLPRD